MVLGVALWGRVWGCARLGGGRFIDRDGDGIGRFQYCLLMGIVMVTVDLRYAEGDCDQAEGF